MKLYSFSKAAWHVRFFKWLFNVNPAYRYKTMCPYFWTYVLIFLFLPLILIIKLFGKSGTKFLNWVKDYKVNKEKKAIAHLKELCMNPDLTNEGAFNLLKSKCYKEYCWEIGYDRRLVLEEMRNMYYEHLRAIKHSENIAKDARLLERSQKYEAVKEQKWFTPVSYIVTFGMIGLLLYAVGYMAYQGGKMIDWPLLGEFTLIILAGVATIGAAYLIIYEIVKYMIIPFVKWVSCIKLPECGICENVKAFFPLFKYIWIPIRYILVGIAKFFAIIGDMIYSTYKKRCPIITWEDE